MQKITPFLWFNDNAEEAVNFYLTVFRNSRITKITRYSESAEKAAGRSAGSVMTVEFELEGERFIALNGGPHFTFSPAISFVVNCDSQKEIDILWDKLSAGGSIQQCGWLQDRYGISWQIVPILLGELMSGADPDRANRVMEALLQMKKLDIGKLRQAYEQD